METVDRIGAALATLAYIAVGWRLIGAWARGVPIDGDLVIGGCIACFAACWTASRRAVLGHPVAWSRDRA